MTFDEYQEAAKKTAVYPKELGLIYTTLGLAGEAGEVANNVKKIMRDDNCLVTADRAVQIKKELGDCLWYIAQTATEMKISLDSIAQGNIDKLSVRQEKETLKGSGDSR